MKNRNATGLRHVARGALAIAAVVGLGACDLGKTVEVQTPDIVRPEDLTSAAALPNVLAAAIGDFQVAYSGSSGLEGIITYTGLLADEFVNAETFPTRIEVDQRAIQTQNSSTLPIFRQLQRARALATTAADAYQRLDANNPGHAEVLSLGGYTYILLAEGYCSGVPESTVNPDGTFTYGSGDTTEEMLRKAIARFDEAIALATKINNANQLNLARVGKARAQLDLGDFAGAAATAAPVPSTFKYAIQHDENTGRQYNGIYTFAQSGRRFSIGENEGGNGLPFRTLGATDPRLAVRRVGTGFDSSTPLYVTAKYQDRKQEAVLASGVEARLIEAEAALRAGDKAKFLTNLNAARAAAPTFAVIPAVPPAGPGPIAAADLPTTDVGLQNLLFQERAVDLFLTSHRLGDLRRLIRQYGRGSESVFPTGVYPKGGTYGPDVNLPIPFEEQNNPEYKGCFDRNA